MIYLGDFPTGATVYVPFHTFNSAGASVTLTGLAVTDIEVYKDGSTTQRSSDAGYTLLDTDGIDFDSLTGLHGFKIDLSDNTDSGFYVAGSEYMIAVSAVTVDSQTVSFWAATFSIERAGGALALLKNATYGLSALETIVDDLEGRLTAARAGYLDNINNAALATTAAQTGDAYARLGAPVGASISADVAAVQVGVPAATPGSEGGVPIVNSDGRINADTTAINGQALNDNLATLKLKAFDVQNSAGDGVLFASSSGGGRGLKIVGGPNGEVGGPSFEMVGENTIIVDDLFDAMAGGAVYVKGLALTTGEVAAYKTRPSLVIVDGNIVTDVNENDQYNGWLAVFTANSQVRSASFVTDCVAGTPGTITVQVNPPAACDGYPFFIIPPAAAGSAGDPWSTALPGAYGAGSAGNIIGNRLVGTIATGTHNPQTGDAFARLGAPVGASTSADIAAVKTQTAAIEVDTQDLQTQVGTDGAGLTALPWNAAWDAEVQSEVADALGVYDPPTNAEMEARTLLAASYFDPATDTVANVTTVGSVTGAVGSVTGAVGSVTGNVGGSVASVAAGGITAASIAANAIDADAIAADAVTEIQSGLATAAALATVDTNVDSILADTGTDGVVVAAGSKTGYALTSTEHTNIADAILKRDWSAVTGEAARSLLNAARFLRNKWSVSGGTLTVTKEDDSTSAWTAAVTSDAAADPITGSDPA